MASGQSAAKRSSSLGDICTVTIETLATGGEGLARLELDGQRRVVLVPATSPGDVLEVELSAVGATMRAQIRRVIQASPDRVQPPCAYAARCGGCDWMHLCVEAQSRARDSIVRRELAKVLRDDVPIACHHAPRREQWRR